MAVLKTVGALEVIIMGFGLYGLPLVCIHTVKKLNSENLIKVSEGFRSVIINTNFLFHSSLHLFIGIYYA